MADEWDELQERAPRSWLIRRWAAPAALAACVAASIGAVHLWAPGPAATGEDRVPRFIVTTGEIGTFTQGVPRPWFQVGAPGEAMRRPVDSVPAPPSAGAAQSIIAGPDGTFVLSAFQEKSCTTRLFRFRLTPDGQVKDLAPLPGGTVPTRVAGLAMSPDGDRLAYATAPCADAAQPQAAVTVLDVDSGRRRNWSTAAPSVVGEIVWARDNRTLGYTIADMRAWPLRGGNGPGFPPERRVENVTLHALDMDRGGSDLRAGRVLFRQPDGSAPVTTAVMAPDGRRGYGVMKRARPASMVFFAFTPGKPMKVTGTIDLKPNTAVGVILSSGGEPRYACLGGIDSFGRVVDGGFRTTQGSGLGCSVAYAY
ncbi:hypothetical protein AB0C21_34005 [Spirillospora sp. NPDC049024]